MEREQLARVRARIAAVATDAHREAWRVGGFSLRPAQRTAVRRIRAAFGEFGGALLADPPGAGKTIVALAVAATFRDVLVVAPSTLRAQWERAAGRAKVAIRFKSIETLSREQETEPSVRTAALVIVDEAHHARNPAAKRYGHLAAACSGVRVLLLSATPVVNRRADRDALLALFLGSRATTLSAAELARCIVRSDAPVNLGPEVIRLPSLVISDSLDGARVAESLRALPPPLPASDGAAALALIRITLAMAWSSSLAALDAALRRRVQRGEALADSLAEGRWPTRDALRQWIMTEDATQLAFPSLDPVERAAPGAAERTLREHLAAVRQLRALVAPCVAADSAARADALRALMRASPPRQRAVVFASHAATIRALWGALRGDGGVVAITGDRVMAAEGRWTREEILRRLGPRALPLRDDDPLAIRLLLTTDILAEGVELQGVGTLVHGDFAWTPARHEQREGRIVRPGRPPSFIPDAVLVTGFSAPDAAAPLLQLARRLSAKQRSRTSAVADARYMELLQRELVAWHAPAGVTRRSRGRTGSTGRVLPCSTVAAALSSRDAFLAVVRTAGRDELICGWRANGVGVRLPANDWRTSTAPRALAAVARLATRATDPACATVKSVREVRAVLARWAQRRQASALLGAVAPGGRAGALPRVLQEQAERALRAIPISERAARGAAIEGALAALARRRDAGLERRLGALLRTRRSAHEPARGSAHDSAKKSGFEHAVLSLAASFPSAPATLETSQGEAPRPRLLALLILVDRNAAPATPAGLPPLSPMPASPP